MTVREAAEYSHVCERTVRRWADEGRLRVGRTHPGRGGRLVIRRADLDALLGLAEEVVA